MGGIGMSGIAYMYLSMGHPVQGSDIKKNKVLGQLAEMGAKVFIGHDASHVSGADIVVYSSSIAPDHPERVAAQKAGVLLLHRAEALALLCKDKFTIAVAGTHGKTTTTALIGMILKDAKRDPSIVVGGMVSFFSGNACFGEGKEMVIEADESDSSFLKFSPDIEVITNIEEEHMDHFSDVEAVEKAFEAFVKRMGRKGFLVGCAEDERAAKLVAKNSKRASGYGFKKNGDGLYAQNITECPGGRRGVEFEVWKGDTCLGVVRLKIMGSHNVLNSLAALTVGLRLGVDFPTAAAALERYEGAARRFDVKYEDEDFWVVDDYAHHPTEIRKTLAAAKALKRNRIVAVFQPHRYSRTQRFLNDFATSFFDVDKFIVTDIYGAGEKVVEGLSAHQITDLARQYGHKDAVFIERSHLTDVLSKEIKKGDLVMLLGAGDVCEVSDELSHYLKNQRTVSAKSDLSNPFRHFKGKVLIHEPLAKHTTLKVGGPVDFWIEPQDKEELGEALRICRASAIPVQILGLGSNVLAPDEGIEGAVIHLGSPYFREVSEREGKIIARGGVPNSVFIPFAVERGYGGCEFLLGVPGSIGGSVVMNAGSHGASVDEFLESVLFMDMNGVTRTIQKKDIQFHYRSSDLKHGFVIEAQFAFPKKPIGETQAKLNEYREYRQKTQDLFHPSAGCMFKNPKDAGCSSGKFIDDAGLKGKRVGNAQISEKHGNFIINLGGATAQDILSLMEMARTEVKRQFGVELESEVKILRGVAACPR